jgi:hypothetical protein
MKERRISDLRPWQRQRRKLEVAPSPPQYPVLEADNFKSRWSFQQRSSLVRHYERLHVSRYPPLMEVSSLSFPNSDSINSFLVCEQH